jgi:hypothetical protein
MGMMPSLVNSFFEAKVFVLKHDLDKAEQVVEAFLKNKFKER